MILTSCFVRDMKTSATDLYWGLLGKCLKYNDPHVQVPLVNKLLPQITSTATWWGHKTTRKTTNIILIVSGRLRLVNLHIEQSELELTSKENQYQPLLASKLTLLLIGPNYRYVLTAHKKSWNVFAFFCVLLTHVVVVVVLLIVWKHDLHCDGLTMWQRWF